MCIFFIWVGGYLLRQAKLLQTETNFKDGLNTINYRYSAHAAKEWEKDILQGCGDRILQPDKTMKVLDEATANL